MATSAACEVAGTVVVVRRRVEVAGPGNGAAIEIADGIDQCVGIVVACGLIRASHTSLVVALSCNDCIWVVVTSGRVGAANACEEFTRTIVGCGLGIVVAGTKIRASQNQATQEITFALFL